MLGGRPVVVHVKGTYPGEHSHKDRKHGRSLRERSTSWSSPIHSLFLTRIDIYIYISEDKKQTNLTGKKKRKGYLVFLSANDFFFSFSSEKKRNVESYRIRQNL